MTHVVILAVVFLAAASIMLFQFFRERRESAQFEPGYREFVKDPSLWDEMINAHEEAAATVADTSRWDEAQIAEEVERYVFSPETKSDLWVLERQLIALSPKTNEALLGILSDNANEARLKQLLPSDLLDDAPVIRVCKLFDGNMPAEAIELLTPYLSHESNKIRQACILAVAESGLPEALPAIKRALADEDEYVRSFCLIGIKRAIESDKLSHEVGDGVIDDLDRLVTSDLNVEDSARLMAQIDPAHAQDFLLSEAVLHTDKRYLHEVLRVIGQFDFPIERAKVKSLLDTYAGLEMKFPNTYVLGELLALLGKFGDPDDEKTLEQFSNHEEEQVSYRAAQGLIAFHNLEEFQDRIWEQEKNGGWDALSKEQQMYQSVFLLDAEVRNGGHSQYFFNSTGNNWQIALDGLIAMRLKEHREIFEDVIELFGDQKPLTDRRKRQDQLAAIFSEHERAFNEFDSAYYEAKESVGVFLTRFVIQNADKFQ
ncbi:MAG: DUF4375 domain-containing protein [Rubinisphaera brasiliensis]|uniref:DMP19 family protein n=1 Tax=Rubinisphaera brasiliensis TaxID=119 RepID=UPI0039197E8C